MPIPFAIAAASQVSQGDKPNTINVAGRLIGRLLGGGPPRKKSACDVIAGGDQAEFLAGGGSNARMRAVIGNRRSDFQIAYGLKRPPRWSSVPPTQPMRAQVPSDAELARFHLDYYVPICQRMEAGNFTVEGARGGKGLQIVHAARDEFMMAIREGRLGQTAPGGSRALTGGDPGPSGAFAGPGTPTGQSQPSLSAGFGGNLPMPVILGLAGLLAFAAIRRG